MKTDHESLKKDLVDIKDLLKIGWSIQQSDKERMAPLLDQINLWTNLHKDSKVDLEVNLLKVRLLTWEDHYLEAIELASHTYEKMIEIDDDTLVMRALRILSWVYFYLGRFDESLEYAFKALKVLENKKCLIVEGETSIEAMLLATIASVYMKTNRDEEALEFQLRAIELCILNENEVSSTFLINLSEIYLKLHDFEKALLYCNQVHEMIQQQSNNYLGHYQCSVMYGTIYTEQNKYKEAEEAFERALDCAKKINRKRYQINVEQRMGELYLKQELYEKAITSLEATFHKAEAIHSADKCMELALLLSKAYEAIQDVHKSIAYYKKFKEVSDDILSQKVQSQLNQHMIEFKVEQARKDAEIFRLRNIELKRKTDELMQANRNIQVISEIGKEITSTLNIEEILLKLYNHFNQLMDASVFGIGLVDESCQQIDYRMFIESGIRLKPFIMTIENGPKFSSKCILNKEALYVPVVNRNTAMRFPGALNDDKHEVNSLIYCPLMIKEQVIGILTVQSYVVNAYTLSHFEVIKALASFIAIALNNSSKSEQLEKTAKTLERLSNTDVLTEIHNRRSILQLLEEEALKFKRYNRRFTVVMADIDHFKEINDKFGHDYGDSVLKTIAKVLVNSLRQVDYVARWGGEEFLLLLPETSELDASLIAERIRQQVEEMSIGYMGQQFNCTLTFGIAEYEESIPLDQVIRHADQALYEGKREGRNRVVVYK